MSRNSPNQRHIHFIGIGGIGMSALALVLAEQGYVISGSDQNTSKSFENLIAKGITIFTHQNALNITKICASNQIPPLVVISTAIPETNPEYRAAKNANLKILHRSDLLDLLLDEKDSIVIAGTHGKTTTSTFITTLLELTNHDPTAFIGGLVPIYKSNAHAGKGKLAIAEADESDGTIIKFKPNIGIITNLELDHTNHYTNLDSLIKTMKKFANNSKKLLANYDCGQLRKHFKSSIWWSTKTTKGVQFAAIPYSITGKKTSANFYEKGELIGEIHIPIPGLHNLSNLTGAIAACRLAGVSFNTLKGCLNKLETPIRRFEFRGIWNKKLIVDDYAHHPSEISATLSMVRLMIDSQQTNLPKVPSRIISVFQPHRFSRTRDLLNDFAKSFNKCDLIILAPIYSAGERPIDGVNSEVLAKCIQKMNPDLEIIIAKNFNDLITLIKKYTLEGDLILNMGAGDINQVWEKLTEEKEDFNENPIRKVA